MQWHPALRPALFVLVLILLALATYGWILGFYFTQPNTFPTIRSARIQETADLARILSGPMKSIREEPDKVYRPVSSLSFSLDHAIWELEPLGYHLTDLVLVTLLSIGLFFLVRRLGADDWTGLLAGGLLLLNPILLDVLVPISHRQNTLAALFVVWAFWAYLGFRRRRWRTGGYTAGLLITAGLFLAAMGSKESGVVFLLLVLVYEALEAQGVDPETSWGETIRKRAPHVLPMVGVAVLYVGVWLRVTAGRALWGSRGGAFRIEPLFAHGITARVGRFFRESLYVYADQYLRTLINPSLAPVPEGTGAAARSFLRDYFGLDPSTPVQLGSLGLTLLVLVGIVMSLSGRMGGGTAAAKRMGLSREGLEAWLSSLGQGALGLALLLAAAFPLVTRSVQGPLREAHAGEGYAWLAVFMQGRETLPDAYYLLAARRYLLGVLVAGLSVGVSLWILGRARHLTRRVRSGVSTLRHRPGVRRGLFFAGWLLVVYLFHAFTTTTVSGHGRKRIILGLVGYTGLLAVLVRRAPGVLGSWLIPSWDPSRVRGRSRSLESLTVMVALMLVLGIAVASPLTSGDRRFRQPQRMYRLLYAQLERQFVRLPERAELEVRGIPQWAGWRERPPKYPLMSGSLLRLNFPAWLKLRFPDKGFVVRRRESARLLGGCPCHTWVERQQVGSHVFVFQAHWHQQGRSDREPDRAEKRGERSAKR